MADEEAPKKVPDGDPAPSTEKPVEVEVTPVEEDERLRKEREFELDPEKGFNVVVVKETELG